jgi:hypothetical protein
MAAAGRSRQLLSSGGRTNRKIASAAIRGLLKRVRTYAQWLASGSVGKVAGVLGSGE